MLTKFKAPLTAIMLSSVAVVPAATVAFMGSADMAIAKSDKAGGGQGGQKASKSQAGSKGKSGTKGSSGTKGKSGTKSSSAGGAIGSLGNKVDKFLGKVTGKDKARKSAARTQSAKIAKDDLMHPSNLGKMNGPMHASINAVLAHIRNGNTNGPIGAFAGLAVANSNASGAQEIIDLQEDFQDLETALANAGYGSVEEYYAALEGEAGISPIDDIEKAVDDAALADALSAAGYGSLEEYEAAKAGTAPADKDMDLDDAITALGGDTETGVLPSAIEPTEEEVAEAEADLEALSDAEKEMLTHWNKDPDAEYDTITDEERAILDALYDRLAPYEEEIAAAIPEEEAAPEEGAAAEELGEGEPVECAEGDAGCAADEDIAAAE